MNWLLEKLRQHGPMTSGDLANNCHAKRHYENAAAMKRDLDELAARGLIEKTIVKPHVGRPGCIYHARNA